jgi:hypothetical protein
MKDFACQASLKKKKKSLSSCFKNFFSLLKKLVKLSIGLTISLLFFGVLLWMILPHMLSPHNNINIVFVNQKKDVKEREYLFASFDFELNKIQAFLIDDSFEISLVDDEELIMQPVTFSQKINEFNPQKLRTQHMSWLTARVVEQVIYFKDSQTSVSDLPKLLKEQLASKLFNFNFKNLDEIKQLTYLLMLLRRGEYQFVTQQQTNLPTTSVLPNNCSVAVINTTRIGGYASALTSILEKSGARIIRVDSGYQQEEFEQTAVAFNQEKTECHYAVQTLADHLFMESPVGVEEDQAQSLLNRFRSDMVILLSDDQAF